MHTFYFSVILISFSQCLDHVHSNQDSEVLFRSKRSTCGGTIQWRAGQTKQKLKLANKGQKQCSWHAVGSEICRPQITCPKVDLKGNDEEGLVISDAIGGELRLIGKEAFKKPRIGSKGARDLFIDYEGSVPGKGFECEVSCGHVKGGKSTKKKRKGVTPLPSKGSPRREEYQCVCGIQNKEDRIVGGEDGKLNEFPWLVALVKPGTRQPFCGGAVINNRFILTAAHCFVLSGTTEKQVEVLHHAQLLDFTITNTKASKSIKLGKVGSMQGRGYEMAKKSDKDEKTRRWKVAEIINHDLFSDEFDYDVALVKLEKKIDLTAEDAPTPICLPKPADYKNLYEGAKPWVVGWGLADEYAGATTRLLQKLQVPIIPFTRCREIIPDQLTMRMMCAGFLKGGKDSCTGDSGGPLSVLGKNKQWTQIGIVSFGEGCSRKNSPGFYSRVTEFVQWINYYTNQPDVKWCRSSR